MISYWSRVFEIAGLTLGVAFVLVVGFAVFFGTIVMIFKLTNWLDEGGSIYVAGGVIGIVLLWIGYLAWSGQ